MPDPNRLNDLKRRWAQDPGSRLYLQLADEHRKHGQLAEAEAVLVKGLEHRPSDLSGLVALGRCRLELGKLDQAITALETVLARDPAHMVANKLLIEAHLQRGDGEQAGQRLETYRLFNDRDPELVHFDDRLRQLSGGSSSTVEPQAAEPQAAEPERVRPEPETAEPAAVAEAMELPAAEPVAAEPEPQPVAAVAIPRAAPSNGGTPHRGQIFDLGAAPAAPNLEALWREPPPPRLAEPFSGLIAGSAAAVLTRGDVFRVEPPPPVAEPLAEEPPPMEEPPVEEPAPQALISEPPPVDEEAPTERVEIVELPTEPPVTAALTDEPATDEMPTEKFEIRFPAAEPPPVTAEAAAEERLPEPPSEPAEPAAVAAESEEGEAATVTLGGLYLKQGHHQEAARIFEQVLEQDPSNPAARAGLNLARRPPAAPLTAMDLLADRSLSGTLPMGLTARKLQVLANYLKHIQSVRERDHVH